MKALFTENPMMAEVKRFLRRFLNIRRGPLQAVAIALVLLIYLVIVGLFAAAHDIEPLVIVYLQTVLYCLILPAMLQGSIAGEREKGTWETLLAAPVTKGQIVVGKYAGAVLVVLAVAFLMAPLWELGVGREEYRYGLQPIEAARVSGLGPFLRAECVAITFGLALASWCLFVSARSRRTFSAQGMIYCSMVLALIVWPMLASALLGPAWENQILLNPMHPFMIESAVFDSARSTARSMDTGALTWNPGVFTSLLNVGFAVLFLVWSEFTLRYAEMDVRFIPRRNRASDR